MIKKNRFLLATYILINSCIYLFPALSLTLRIKQAMCAFLRVCRFSVECRSKLFFYFIDLYFFLEIAQSKLRHVLFIF